MMERMKSRSPEIDAYIDGAAPFARPILKRVRAADPHGIFEPEGMWGGGKITEVAQLPSAKVMVEYVKAAARLNEAGPRKKRPRGRSRP
jgi:hypothetical protein